MRKNPPEPERRMWRHLRNRQLSGCKFRRQAVIGYRIVDFFCPQKGVIVEIDGDAHDPANDRLADRDMMKEHGFVTVRYANSEVMENLDGVLEHLSEFIENVPQRWSERGFTTPQPPPLKRRGRTVTQTLRDAANALADISDTARLDAELLMAEALEMPRSDMLLKAGDMEAPPRFHRLLARRRNHEPVAYILERQEFYGREFLVTPDVLIPRSDSETVVGAALAHARNNARILDLGTGSGALLLTLLAELPDAEGVGIDASLGAVSVAAANAARLNVGARAQILHRDWNEAGWTGDLGLFDLIVANPPYVEAGAELDRSVREYEPAQALFASADGLEDYRTIIPQLRELLTAGGAAILEIGHKQEVAVTEIAAEAGFSSELHRDLAHRPRALLLR